jgi:serine/threonine protein kinase
LNKEDNFHLVKLLGTYKYRDQYYLLFPWADGNLLEFWQENQSPCTGVIEHDWVLWFSQQCLGIAQGLEKIHKAQNPDSNSGHDSSDRLHGRHGDLKPENILWFKNSQTETNSISKSVLKISDFGLTRFHRDESKSGIDAGTVGNSPTYRAPEYDVMSTVSQNYDIWALGCVLLEFAAWFLLGWSEIQAFSTNRIAEDNATVPEDNFYVLVVLMGKNGETGARLKASVAKVNQAWCVQSY